MPRLVTTDSFNGKPKATVPSRRSVAFGLPLNEECVGSDTAEYMNQLGHARTD
jgi:hypothetical protein